MKKYTLEYAVIRTFWVEIEADTEEAAIAALEKVYNETGCTPGTMTDANLSYIDVIDTEEV